MSFAWYFEFFSGRQADPVWRVLIYPWTAWTVIPLVVLFAWFFYYQLRPTMVNRRNWILLSVISAAASFVAGLITMLTFPPRLTPPLFIIACIFLGPLVFFVSSLLLKMGSTNGRYVPTEKP